MGYSKKSLPLVVFFSLITASIIYADNSPVPSRESAGVQQTKFREEKLEQKEAEKIREKKSPQIEEKEARKIGGRAEGERFLVKAVKFLGNRSFSDTELQPMAVHLLNKEITLGQIDDAVAEIKKFYRAHGFIATYVYVPQQQLKEDTLKIDILEGRLGEISLNGNHHYKTELIKQQFRLKPGEVLKYEPLRRDLARLNNNQDIKAKAVMEPGAETGTTNLAIQVEDRSPIHYTAEISNTGTYSTGIERYSLNATHNNLLGRMDKFGTALQLGQHSTAYGGSYSVPLSYEWGTRLSYSYVHAVVDVKGDYKDLNVKGIAKSHNVTLIQPVVESESMNADLKVGFDIKGVENRMLGSVTGKDNLRVFNPGLNLDLTDAAGRTFSTQDFNFGLSHMMGASDENDVTSREGTGGDFFSYRGMVMRYQKLFGDVFCSAKGNIQLTSNSLAPSEQLSLGGARSIRGYQEGDYLGDYGGIVNLDVYVPADFLPQTWYFPASKEPMKKQVQVVGFADWGVASLNESQSGETKTKELAGVGAGLRIHLFDKMYSRFEYGFREGDEAANHKRSVFHFSVSYEFM